jgi:hypothetical protein
VESGEDDALSFEAHVLDIRRCLVLKRHRPLAQALGAAEHHATQVGQALQVVVAAVVQAVAVGPLVVARGVDGRRLQAVEQCQRLGVDDVVAA